ncbi:MAG: acyltransferase [Syntrophaceae bacterium]|nr:acyltransferase [Syntrophaceae bacterium]
MVNHETSYAGRILFLDALRGLAAVWVVLYHMVFIPKPNLVTPVWASSWVRVGGMGVTLFFLFTGFSICYTMKAHQMEQRPFLSFYIRRFFRVAPLLYLLIIAIIIRNPYYHSSLEVAANFLFVFNLFPGWQTGIVWASWYIGALVFLYLLSPLVYQYFNNLRKAAIFILLSVVMFYAFKCLIKYIPFDYETYFQWSFIRHLPIFASGVLIYYILKRNPLHQFKYKKSTGLFLLGISLLLFIGLLLKKLPVLDQYHWQAIIFSIFIIGVAINPLNIIVNNYTVYLGKLSLSLYLCHPILIVYLTPLYRYIYAWPVPLSIQYLIIVCITLFLLIGISFLTYKIVEEPFVRMGKKCLDSIKRRNRRSELNPA